MKLFKKNKVTNESQQAVPFFEKQKKEDTTFFSGMVPQLQLDAETGNSLHDPILDEYSRQTGLPRHEVSAHDPLYEDWVTGIPLAPVTIKMPVPSAIPVPDYSKTMQKLGAMERANFIYTPMKPLIRCESFFNKGVESSFVKKIVVGYDNPLFEFLMAKEIGDNKNDMTQTSAFRQVWRRLDYYIKEHAVMHFSIYNKVVADMEKEFAQEISALPGRSNPIQIPKQDLENHVQSLVNYLMERLHFELWKATCDLERADYPNIIAKVNAGQVHKMASSVLNVNCTARPPVSQKPVMPVVVKPGNTPVPKTSGGSSKKP